MSILNKKISVILIGMTLAILLLFWLFKQKSQEFSKAQATEDLIYLVTKIKETHISAITVLPKSVNEQYQQELSKLQAWQSLAILQTALNRVVMCLQDAHARVEDPRNRIQLTATGAPFIRYTIDPQSRFAVLVLDACENNDLYRLTLRKFFEQVKFFKIPYIALDLRNNTGGDSEVIYEFIRYLPCHAYHDYSAWQRKNNRIERFEGQIKQNKKYLDLTYSGKIYVLTAHETFSSAMMFSVVLQDNKLARVIGEPSREKPTDYGDVVRFSLPNSKLVLNLTYKKFFRPDHSKDQNAYQVPDYPVSATQALIIFKQLACYAYKK